ncbi:hypothetical protein LOTGIDRAFT_123812, partial [Lottia gigantea]
QSKIETAKVEDLLIKPGRLSRPSLIVVIVRGLPGSGKTYVSKLIRDKEVSNGGAAPRMLCLDDYFMVEVEKKDKDPETGKQISTKVLEYQYEAEVEEAYRQSLYKSFKKTIDDGFFPFIVIDATHEKVKHFEEFWSYAKSKGFQVYIVEVEADVSTCIKRNIHDWQQKDVERIKKGWEPTPSHFMRLDIRSLLQEDSITEVEMEDESNDDTKQTVGDVKTSDDEDDQLEFIAKSKWEIADKSESQMDKLDGIRKRKRTPSPQGWDDYLQIAGEDYFSRVSEPGKKRVRWVDIEEHKQQLRQRQLGFVIGQTQRDWDRITDDNFAHRAMNQTKYF